MGLHLTLTADTEELSISSHLYELYELEDHIVIYKNEGSAIMNDTTVYCFYFNGTTVIQSSIITD